MINYPTLYKCFKDFTNHKKKTNNMILGVTEILCNFRLVLEGKTGKETPDSSRLESLEKFFSNSFPLLNGDGNTSRPLNREGTAGLPLLRRL